ncbi:hypothetical protein [Streptomyces sp. NBC_00091]|uniref:hypothetical protein n=1 Tax=Streptomyces sp. NBC_00091 TaxID=2975648 RepID=UPI0022522249|nr:hypothetical protein [Streptomyces sp. NBC_00091]MCX5377348.1 hypothetical protein [Streptomyces sp. NBC_00091]
MSVSTAHADGGLLSGILSPVVCGLQTNVNGNNNQVAQGGTCEQTATPTPPNGGGITGYQVIPIDTVTLGPNQSAGRGAFCPAGKRALSGGVVPTTTGTSGLEVNWSGPNADGTRWEVAVDNEGDQEETVTFYIVCANAAS